MSSTQDALLLQLQGKIKALEDAAAAAAVLVPPSI
jgi:hypothetical protein